MFFQDGMTLVGHAFAGSGRLGTLFSVFVAGADVIYHPFVAGMIAI